MKTSYKKIRKKYKKSSPSLFWYLPKISSLLLSSAVVTSLTTTGLVRLLLALTVELMAAKLRQNCLLLLSLAVPWCGAVSSRIADPIISHSPPAAVSQYRLELFCRTAFRRRLSQNTCRYLPKPTETNPGQRGAARQSNLTMNHCAARLHAEHSGQKM